MALNHTQKALSVILLMAGMDGATTDQLLKVLGTTRRNLFYYIAALRDYGFLISRENKRYYIEPQSPFLQKLAPNVTFSDSEALFLYRLVRAAEKSNLTDSITRKLERFYDLNILANPDLQNRMAKNVEQLCKAIDKKRVAMLRDYVSPHSGTVSNRIVEPYRIMNNNVDVQCYEVNSGMNKIFKVSRMGSVIVSDDLHWSHEYMHKQLYSDVFGFSGTERHPVKLRLGLLSYNLLREEYPLSAHYLRDDDGRHWLLDTFVTSYLGIGRFILGLFSDIEVLEDEGLREYVGSQVKAMQDKLDQANLSSSS